MNSLPAKSNTPAMSEDICILASAFLLAKQDFIATGMGGVNSHQKYKYAKIEDIYNAVENALSKNNIIIWHFARPDAGIEYLYTRLIHTLSGQFIEDVRILESEKPGNQAKGAANTYMKKYAVLSLCAIATEDDDGEEEQKHIDAKNNKPDQSPVTNKNRSPQGNVVGVITNEQLAQLIAEIKKHPVDMQATIVDDIYNYNKVGALSELKQNQFEGALRSVCSKIK